MSDNYKNITYKLRFTAFHICCFRFGKNAETKMHVRSAYIHIIWLILFPTWLQWHSNMRPDTLSHRATASRGPGLPLWVFSITLRHTTLDRTPLDEWWARRRDLYVTTHNTHKRQTSMPPAVFETTIPASERLQPQAVDRAAHWNRRHVW